MVGPTTFLTFSLRGNPAKAKLLILGGSSPALADRSRSLNIEHVSSTQLVRSEISRQTPLGRQAGQALQRGFAASDETLLAVLRRWFWTRKPDAGFVLADFPATLLQAKVFDEWLEARGEQLTACLLPETTPLSSVVVDHYRTLGHDVVAADAFLS